MSVLDWKCSLNTHIRKKLRHKINYKHPSPELGENNIFDPYIEEENK